MAYQQGAIVIGSDPFGGNDARPYLVVSGEEHPFVAEEYVAALVTTTEREPAVSLEGEYVEGELPYESFVNPWNVLTLKDSAIRKRVAQVSAEVVSTTAKEIYEYVSLDSEA